MPWTYTPDTNLDQLARIRSTAVDIEKRFAVIATAAKAHERMIRKQLAGGQEGGLAPDLTKSRPTAPQPRPRRGPMDPADYSSSRNADLAKALVELHPGDVASREQLQENRARLEADLAKAAQPESPRAALPDAPYALDADLLTYAASIGMHPLGADLGKAAAGFEHGDAKREAPDFQRENGDPDSKAQLRAEADILRGLAGYHLSDDETEHTINLAIAAGTLRHPLTLKVLAEGTFSAGVRATARTELERLAKQRSTSAGQPRVGKYNLQTGATG